MLHKNRILGHDTSVAGRLQDEERHTGSRVSVTLEDKGGVLFLEPDNCVNGTQTGEDFPAAAVDEDEDLGRVTVGGDSQVSDELGDTYIINFTRESDEFRRLIEDYTFDLPDCDYWGE